MEFGVLFCFLRNRLVSNTELNDILVYFFAFWDIDLFQVSNWTTFRCTFLSFEIPTCFKYRIERHFGVLFCLLRYRLSNTNLNDILCTFLSFEIRVCFKYRTERHFVYFSVFWDTGLFQIPIWKTFCVLFCLLRYRLVSSVELNGICVYFLTALNISGSDPIDLRSLFVLEKGAI